MYANHIAKRGRLLAIRAASFQAVFCVLLILIVLLINKTLWLDVAFGCIAALFPNAIFAYFAFKFSGATQNNAVVRSFSLGAKVKLILTATLFAIAFAQLQANPLPLFSAYVAATIVYIIVLYRNGSM